MIEWMLRKQQLRSGEITKEEYQEWKLNWPQTADDCGKFQPKKEWRKKNRDMKSPPKLAVSEGIFMSLPNCRNNAGRFKSVSSRD